MIIKIISGGQTGADQAALDAAIELGIPHGGWIPKGRLTEAGSLPDSYQLVEMPTKDYLRRTRQNVLDSDGTVTFSHGDLKGGSKRTADFATELHKPFLHVDLKKTLPAESSTATRGSMSGTAGRPFVTSGPSLSSKRATLGAVFGRTRT